jgi:U32 family peptidase
MNMPAERRLKIVAPINSPEDVELFHNAGASELYCGVLPEKWVETYGSSDTLNKRQGLVANLASFAKLYAIQEKAKALNMPVALTLNTSYTEEMLPMVLEIASGWANAGGDAIMVSDVSLLLAMQKELPALRRHLSILANTFNSSTLQFYRRFDISRVVLPRELTIPEMKELIDVFPGMEYEVMAFNDKCRFIDGQCYFYHSTVFNAGQRTAFQVSLQAGQARVFSFDPAYSGHGCTVLFGQPDSGTASKQAVKAGNPGCAACFVAELSSAGVGYLKLGGRGLPAQKNARNIAFMKHVIDGVSSGQSDPQGIRSFYRETFGQDCVRSSCYYAESAEAG